MESLIIQFTKNVEKKRIHIVVKRLVIQKQLRDVAQVLAVHLLLQSIDFKHGEFAVAVNLISSSTHNRMLKWPPLVAIFPTDRPTETGTTTGTPTLNPTVGPTNVATAGRVLVGGNKI